MPAVFSVDLDVPVKQALRFANVLADFGDGYEQRANKNQAYSRADGLGGVTSYKGRNRFAISMDMLAHVNGDATAQANKLWAFYVARLGGYEAFYFYNTPAEAAAPDLTGVSTTGRYLVRFEDQELSRELFALKLFKSSIGLIEVRS